jgi:lycopene cyclase domain-containing protein
METYLILNTIFVLAISLSLLIFRRLVFNKYSLLTLIILFVLTAIFDSIIISSEIVAYDESKLIGLSIGQAPIEDFFYTLLSVILLPSLWNTLRNKKDAKA